MTDDEVYELLRRIARMTDEEFREWEPSEERARIRVVPDELGARATALPPHCRGSGRVLSLP
jgi:hypothetical protein